MGLIGWIKKEIESNSRTRRQSAPPPSLYNMNDKSSNNVNQYRDEAYMKAISRFNEYRNNQRVEKLNETKNASNETNAVANEESIITADISISDLEIEESEKQRLVEIAREQRRAKNQNVRKIEHKVDFYMTQTQQQQRFSLPIMKDNNGGSLTNRKTKRGKVHPTNTIDEIEEFESNHCHKIDEEFSRDAHMSITSPPNKFYRENSEPFSEESKKKKITPKKLMGRNMLRRGKSHSKGRAPPPPIVDSESSSGFRNGNFKRFDVVSSSAYEEFLKQSNIYQSNFRHDDPEKVDSVGESASSGSSSSDIDKNSKKNRRMSPPYLTVINKHGEEVEYALPYSERESLATIPPLPDTPAPDFSQLPPSQFDQIINENFNFLKTHLDFTRLEEGDFDKPYAPYDEIPPRKKVQVTDLDRSNDASLIRTASGGDIIKELDSLSKWTNSLRNCIEKSGDEKLQIEDYVKINEKIRVFRSQDINFKSGILRNSQKLPLEFSFGFLFRTPITLRSTLPDIYNENCIADIASKKDFEMLSQIRHQNIAIMMGISYDSDLRVMSLVMEPFESTLNYYLHQMDQYFTVEQTISIVKQIAFAVQYLHECGFIHSNINSHAILVRRLPFTVKLSSFELTTEILPRESMEKIFHQGKMKDGEASLIRGIPEDRSIVEKYYKLSKQYFCNETSAKELPVIDFEKESRLAYSVDFRRTFSSHFYQAPELLSPINDSRFKFVLPTIRSDIFSLGLLLWETLNHCVPFVIFNYDELVNAYKKREANLPLLDKSCVAFMEILNCCLHRNAEKRLSDVHQLIEMLNHVNVASEDEKYTDKNIADDVKYYEKLPEKVYFQSDETDPQKRAENVISMENLLNTRIKSFSESIKSSEMEANIVSDSQQPEILQDEAIVRIREQVPNQQIVPEMPIRKKEDVGGETNTLELSKRSDSTMFQSFFDLNRLTTPKVDKNGIYERTSTLKKRAKVDRNTKTSVKGLFDTNFDKMNSELNQIVQPDFLSEIRQEMNERNQKPGNFARSPMKNDQSDVSRSSDDIRLAYASPKTPNMKRSDSDNVATNDDYDFEMQSNQLQKTPIARQNKIRRNAWLSESKKPSGGRNSDESFTPNKSSSDVSATKKNFNVSIKIHRNDIDKSSTKEIPSPSTPSTLTKINNAEVNSPKNKMDLNKKYYPMMPEMLSDVIRNKREKSFVQTSCDAEEDKSQAILIEPTRSVKETVKFIEANFSPKIYQRSVDQSPVTPKLSNEETQTEMFFIPQLRGISDENDDKDDEARECMTKASKSIQKLSEIMSNNSEKFPQIRQAQVTVNVQQITHRASDIGQLKQFQDQNRHSICNSAELIKRFQMHIKSTGTNSLEHFQKNDDVSASCSSLVLKCNDKTMANQQTGKCGKYFCRNCGFTMLPAELLQKLQGSGRLSLASSFAHSLQSITKAGEDGLTTVARCPTISETRSTEDIYIDDDFCQGISNSLAANMELLPSQNLFGSLDFDNIFGILHSHPIDWSLPVTEDKKNQLEWRENDNEDDKIATVITGIEEVDAETKDNVDIVTENSAEGKN